MFIAEFIFICFCSGVSVLPEGLDEEFSFVSGVELQKNIFFFRCDDVKDLFFYPAPVILRKVFRFNFSRNKACLDKKETYCPA